MNNEAFITQRELLKTALEATDNYLALEKRAIEQNAVTNVMLHDFTYHMSKAHDALQSLGVLDEHMPYMKTHVTTMMKIHGHDDPTIADLPFTHVPKADYGEVEESLNNKAAQTGLSIELLSEIYETSAEKWAAQEKQIRDVVRLAMGEVNSFILKQGKTTTSLTEEDLDKIAEDLKWEDIVDLYTNDELVEEDDINEALSLQARIKKKQTFARFRSRRGVAKKLKLQRASDMTTLQRRAKMAARRSLYKRFLKGRDKSQLSASEKDRIEKQVASLKVIQSTLAQKMMPKIRSIEQKRLAKARVKKK